MFQSKGGLDTLIVSVPWRGPLKVAHFGSSGNNALFPVLTTTTAFYFITVVGRDAFFGRDQIKNTSDGTRMLVVAKLYHNTGNWVWARPVRGTFIGVPLLFEREDERWTLAFTSKDEIKLGTLSMKNPTKQTRLVMATFDASGQWRALRQSGGLPEGLWQAFVDKSGNYYLCGGFEGERKIGTQTTPDYSHGFLVSRNLP